MHLFAHDRKPVRGQRTLRWHAATGGGANAPRRGGWLVDRRRMGFPGKTPLTWRPMGEDASMEIAGQADAPFKVASAVLDRLLAAVARWESLCA
jgi:hypothetical protein